MHVNGELRSLAAPATIADLLRELELRPEQVAVERNKRLVRRAEHEEAELADGDRLEVVTFLGGG